MRGMLDATLHTNRGNLVAHSGPSSFVGVLGVMFRLIHLLGRPASGAERFYRDQHPKPVFSCPRSRMLQKAWRVMCHRLHPVSVRPYYNPLAARWLLL